VWSLAFAQEVATEGGTTAAENGPSSPFGGGFIWLMIAMFAVMYFIMIRPQQKKEKQRQEMLSALGKGDRVVTTGGICGTIVGLSEKSVVLRVSEEPVVKMEFLRAAVSRADDPGEEKDEKEKKK
jgi:preprotein translocase subunit YajC